MLTSSTTVGTDVRRELYRHMLAFNQVMGVATVDNFNHGRSVIYPKSVTAGTATIIGEGTAISEVDPTFGSLTLDSWKYAHLVQLSNELLEDVEFDIIDFIAFDSGRAIGRASGAHFATGDGSNKPRGVIVALANDLGTAVQVASATVETDNLIDLFYSVTPPYREGAFWLMADSTAKAIRKLKTNDDAYAWTPGLNGAPDTILGRPVLVDPSVAAIGSANLSVAFFNPEAYRIRTSPLRFERSNDFAFSSDMVTFRAVTRMDGDLLDSTSTTGAVLDTD